MRSFRSPKKGQTKTMFSFTQTELSLSQQQAITGGCGCENGGEQPPPPPPTSVATNMNLLDD